jgi:uncharacterized protein YdeI (YjbR/CyaY-like superfamily)
VTDSAGAGASRSQLPPDVRLDDAATWRAWLEENHASHPGVQLALAKGKAPGIRYAEALDEALCFGWIDGRKQGLSDTEWLQTFTPRRPGRIWSKRNQEHVERLEREGRMTDAGRAEIARAKANGRWDSAYAGSSSIDVPADLAEALAASQKASAMFATLNSQNRFAILFRIGNVKRAETRARKIAEYVAMLERGETLHKQVRRE